MDLNGQTILLTGGTGSFGNAFVERMLADHPDTTMRVFSRDELKQSEMRDALRRRPASATCIGDVRDRAAHGPRLPRASTSSSTPPR